MKNKHPFDYQCPFCFRVWKGNNASGLRGTYPDHMIGGMVASTASCPSCHRSLEKLKHLHGIRKAWEMMDQRPKGPKRPKRKTS